MAHINGASLVFVTKEEDALVTRVPPNPKEKNFDDPLLLTPFYSLLVPLIAESLPLPHESTENGFGGLLEATVHSSRKRHD
jgi:hypothetical protein